jgi:integral membrane protein
LLGIAMPLKYFAGMPEYVSIIGMAHGILFIWYIIAVLMGREEYRFNASQTTIALAGSFLPFGTFYADKKIFKNL